MGGPGPRVLGGRYELGDALGYGGMADVHRAYDTRLERTVAVKLLRSDLARDPAFRARFRREAQASASLNHPSIVQVFDTGEDDSADGPATPYIVMELVEGRTLRAVLEEQGRLPLQEALVVTADVCAALHYSHERGLVHRDVKPGNVMVTAGDDEGSTVKVMDFGIARAATSSSTMTATAAVLGTAQYLSPEQARGEDVDARSDVYSTGCLLYELVTGRPPFTGDSPVAVAYQQVREDPLPPSAVLADATPTVDAVVLHAMAKNRDNRYGSAAEMREDLLRAANGRPVQAPPVAPPSDAPPPPPAEEATTVLRRTRAVPPPPEEDESSRSGVVWAAVALVALALLVGGVLLVRDLAGPATERTTVPDVAGLSLAEATDALEGADLVVGEITREFSERPVDEVLQQSPTARTAQDAGTAVDLVVSDGVEQVAVPRVVGLSRDEAEAALEGAGLSVGEVTVTDAVAPAGQVRASDPEEGTEVDRGSVVDLVVASGNVPVPDVVGQMAAQAAATLGRQGFEVAEDSTVTGEVAPGTVVAQEPDGGGAAPAGSTVTIVVAVAPEPEPSPTRSPEPTASPSPTRTPSPSPTPTSSPTPSVTASASASVGG